MAFKKSVEKNNDFIYEVIEECGVVCTDKDWEMKLRYMKWNNGPEKYDLRYWKVDDTGKETCRKGITLTGEELEGLQALLNKMN